MITGILGYTLPAPLLSPRVYLEFDYASGDSRPGGNVGTFNQLFPSAHGFLGYMDYIGRQNIISTGGAVLRPGTETTARYIGAEMDLLATYDFTRHLLGYVGYRHFFTGEFIRKTGPSKDSDFFYTAIQYIF